MPAKACPKKPPPHGDLICANCRKRLPDWGGVVEGPCPACGSSEVKQLRSILTGGATIRATAQALYDRTGRVFEGDQPNTMLEYKTWSELATRDAILANPLTEKFLSSLADVPLAVSPIDCFRAVVHIGVSSIALPSDCGPAPADKVGHGRYNRPNVPTLYLGETQDGVRAEVSGSPRWIQAYRVPSGLRIGDFSTLRPSHPANHTFWYAECANRDDHDPGSYLFSQTIAELVQSRFPDGMRVPGTRKHAAPYRNLVIFNHADWAAWLVGEPQLDPP